MQRYVASYDIVLPQTAGEIKTATSLPSIRHANNSEELSTIASGGVSF